jgi:hypothetical protein
VVHPTPLATTMNCAAYRSWLHLRRFIGASFKPRAVLSSR